jgi:hypothetical protein
MRESAGSPGANPRHGRNKGGLLDEQVAIGREEEIEQQLDRFAARNALSAFRLLLH